MTDKDKKEVKQMMIEVLADFWEQVFPTLATKEDLKKVAADVKDIKRPALDIESDTPTRVEFNRLRDKVDKKNRYFLIQ